MYYFGFDFAKWPHPLAVWDDVQSTPSVFKDKFSTNQLSHKRKIDVMRRLIGRFDSDPIVKAATFSNFPYLVQSFDNCDKFVSSLMDNKWKGNSEERLMIDTFIGVMRSLDVIKKEGESTVFFTIPVSFNRLQMSKVESLFMGSGLRVPVFIAQPVAVALMYAHKLSDVSSSVRGQNKNLLIFNMDSAYSDVAVVTISSKKCEIKAMTGGEVGGIEMTSNIVSHVYPNYKDISDKYLDGKNNYSALQKLVEEAEKLIRILSKKEQYNLEINLGPKKNISKVVTKDEFEASNEEVFLVIERLIRQCLNDSKVTIIDSVVIVGCYSDIPKVHSVVSQICKAKVLNIGINRLEAALFGAVVAGAINSGQIKMDVVTVTSLSVGVKVGGDNFCTVIPRNTTLPCEKEKCFSPSHRTQSEVLVLVYEGEFDNVNKNSFLGYFKITGIPKVPQGLTNINVSMKIDRLNRLTVKVTLVVQGLSGVIQTMESRMPQDDHGFAWLPEVLKRRYGSTMDLAIE